MVQNDFRFLLPRNDLPLETRTLLTVSALKKTNLFFSGNPKIFIFWGGEGKKILFLGKAVCPIVYTLLCFVFCAQIYNIHDNIQP